MVNVNIIVNTIVKKNNNVFCGWVVSYTRTSYVESIKGVQKVTERDSFIRMCCLLGLFHSYVLHLGTPSFMCVASIKGIYMCCIYKGCTQSLCPRLLQVYVLAYVLPIETLSSLCVASWDSFIHMCCLMGLLHSYDVLPHGTPSFIWCVASWDSFIHMYCIYRVHTKSLTLHTKSLRKTRSTQSLFL